MQTPPNQILKKLTKNPRLIFLIDGIGAFITSLLLSLILLKFEDHFGMPKQVLIVLISMAFVLFLYSTLCYFFVVKNLKLFLKIVAGGNLIYCGITLSLLFFHYTALTLFDWIYFICEVLVITGLVYVERSLYKAITRTNNKN